MERQCLGLIRDGNTATIVDVVPNSLSARHGLPPKVCSLWFNLVSNAFLASMSIQFKLNGFLLLGSILWWYITDILGANRNQRSSAESIFQRERGAWSPECRRTWHFHIGATIGFDRQTEKTIEIVEKLQRLHRAIDLMKQQTSICKTKHIIITYIAHSVLIRIYIRNCAYSFEYLHFSPFLCHSVRSLKIILHTSLLALCIQYVVIFLKKVSLVFETRRPTWKDRDQHEKTRSESIQILYNILISIRWPMTWNIWIHFSFTNNCIWNGLWRRNVCCSFQYGLLDCVVDNSKFFSALVFAQFTFYYSCGEQNINRSEQSASKLVEIRLRIRNDRTEGKKIFG